MKLPKLYLMRMLIVMFLLLHGWCLIWALDRFWFRELFGTDGMFWKLKFQIQHRKSISDKSFFHCWLLDCHNPVITWQDIQMCWDRGCSYITMIFGNFGNWDANKLFDALGLGGLTGKQHFHSYLNTTKNTSFQNVGCSDIQCLDGNNIGR